MINDAFENFQYNSCISKGICSLSPKSSSLQTVLVLYLRIFSVFTHKLEINLELKLFILNVMSSVFYNPDIDEKSFLEIVDKFKTELSNIMSELKEKSSDIDLKDEYKKANELFNQTKDIIQSIKFGEYIFKRALENIPAEIRDIYNIMLFIAKSLSINLLDLYSYGEFHDDGFKGIIRILSLINFNERDIEILKEETKKAANIDMSLLQLINEAQEKRYGTQYESEVSYSTYPNKAVLVVGSNIRELENVLEKFKNNDIDVYTHDDMMLAYTFPKFKNYPRLKGQFGQGLENCLLDFATFPGPIILTKNSLHNVENFYRGLLFTTDYSSPKGIIKIEDNNFSEVIKSAFQSKGFKTGKQCETINIGYDYNNILTNILDKLNNGNFDNIFLIGADGYSLEQRIYFEKLIRLTPKKTLIISFSYNYEKDNLIYVNTCFDYYAIIKIFNVIKNIELPKTVFIPKCEKSSISQLVYFSEQKNTTVYVGKCAPIILNPSLINLLEKKFNIFGITTAKKDLETIFKDK